MENDLQNGPQNDLQQEKQNKLNPKWVIAAVVVLLIAALAVPLLNNPKKSNKAAKPTVSTTSTTSKKMPATRKDNPPKKDDLSKYDKRVLNYASTDGKVIGTAGIVYDSYYGKLKVIFNFYFKENFAASGTSYFGKLIVPGAEPGQVYASLINVRYSEKDVIGDPFSHYYYDVYKNGTLVGTPSDSFTMSFNNMTSSYQSLLDANKLEVYEAANRSTFNADEAIASGTKIRSYDLKVTPAK